jgi:signal transduction histidine kinase
MRFLILFPVILIALLSNVFAWEYRVSNSLESLKSQPWKPFPANKNPLPREFEGYTEYRTSLEQEILRNGQAIYLGKIGDTDKAFLNGNQIGQTGNFPPQYSYNMDTERVYFVPDEVITSGQNELVIQVYSKFLVNKGFLPQNFKVAPVAEVDSIKYSNELLNNLSKIIIPILCLVLAAVSFPLLAPKHLWNTQVMIFLISLSSFILGICRGRLGYHYFDMLTVYKFTLISSVLTIWLVSVLMTKECKSFVKFLPSAASAFLISAIIVSPTLIVAASWGRVWFHISPFFLFFALYGVLKTRPVCKFRLFGLTVLLFTNINDNLNDLRILTTTSLLQFGLGSFISCMIADQILGLKKSWEKYFMKEVQLEIDVKVGRQAIQIAHDLRSPIETIKQGLNNLEINQPDIDQGIRIGLKRMNEICESLLSKNAVFSKKHTHVEIQSALAEIKSELLLKYGAEKFLNLNIENIAHTQDALFALDLPLLKRTFCNLVTNAIEACHVSGEINLSLSFLNSGLKFQVRDTGIGIGTSMEQLFERGYTTKSTGNGLGLSAAKDYIESLGGSIQIEKLSPGTLVTVFLPSQIKEQNNQGPVADIVLIDDDPLVRFNWKRQGRLAMKAVHTFEKFEEFLQKEATYTRCTPIYIDSNLGDLKGEELSKELVRLGFNNVILTTGSPESNIMNRQWIKRIVGKSFDLAVLGKA